MTRTSTTALLLGLCLGFSANTQADVITGPAEVSLTIVGDDGVNPTQTATAPGIGIDPSTGDFGAQDLTFGNASSPIWQVTDLDINGNADPFVNLDFTITNLSDSDADFIVSALVPISGSFPGPNPISGSLSGVVTDTSGDETATLVSTGFTTPIFTGTVDGTDALPIGLASFTAVGGPGASFSFGPFIDSDPAFGPATSTIGIDIAFTLSAGDTAEISSFFQLVPEPTSAMLLMVGASAVLVRRRA
ncbi:MAG: PEP-CTERM sorting domain-containing protein [Planctomycetota bacterium]